MLYDKKNQELTAEEFKNPGSGYRAAPFWAWNTDLKKEELLRQIDELKSMGFGGFFMHTRAGMSTEYLGDEFMNLVKACRDKAKSEGMLAYLYDEDRWPSGAAGGYVTENPDYGVRYLEFTRDSADSLGDVYIRTLARYDVELSDDGLLASFKRLADGEKAEHEEWNAYVRRGHNSGWFNGYTYLSTTNPDAVKRFIESTYEAYYKAVGEDFGGIVPAIFTDEPRIGGYENNPMKRLARDGKPLSIPFDNRFLEKFTVRYGYDFLDVLPKLFWNTADGSSQSARYDYSAFTTELYNSSFSKQIGDWCSEHGIAFTGHVDREDSLYAQAEVQGDAMAFYKNEGIPGIDLLCNEIRFNTAKQAQSVARQYGKEGVLSELYGVTGWDFGFRGYKYQGDWQAALGVTLRVPHLSWVSMRGSAKRDYPASINYQSAWYREYAMLEDHYARVNAALTRGEPVVRVAMLHPVRSTWLLRGDFEHNGAAIANLDACFKSATDWLLEGQIDFDYVSESLIGELYAPTESGLKLGKVTYEAMYVPPLLTVDRDTLKTIDEFIARGGKVVYSGDAPALVGGKPSDEAKKVFAKAEQIPFNRLALLNAFDEFRDVRVMNSDRLQASNVDTPAERKYLYTMRKDGDSRWLFVAHANEPLRTFGGADDMILTVKGRFKPILYDTLSGEIDENVTYSVSGGNTEINLSVYAYDSVLLKLVPAKEGDRFEREKTVRKTIKKTRFGKVGYSLSEPNVMVLDMPEWSMDGVNYRSREEMLVIDNRIRDEFGYPNATGEDVQPWKIKVDEPDKFPYLRFRFDSEVELSGCRFGYERAVELYLNGERVRLDADGWYADTEIYTTALPTIKKGENELIVRVPISKRISMENCFILGDFGVKVEGDTASLTAKPQTLAFGSVVGQGLPFYGAAVTYKLPYESEGGFVKIVADYYCGNVMTVAVDGERRGRIAFTPYSLELGEIGAGKHEIELTLYASRVNTFGSLHCCVPLHWKGPNLWWQHGNDYNWSYEYCLENVGVMKSPVVIEEK